MRRWGIVCVAVAALVGCTGGGTASGGDGNASGGDGTGGATTDRPVATRDDATGDHGTAPEGRTVVVTSITDGDTFRAGDERVRLIGIDTPEVSGQAECFGEEATAALERLIPVGTEVTLVTDVDPVDRYDRTLAYVHRTSDGLDVNLRMAHDGYAVPLTVPPNVARADAIAAAAADAREAGRGLWSACGGADTPVGDTTPSSTAAPATAPPSTAPPSTAAPEVGADRPGCDPSYPDVCIPPAPPDLDCADVPYRRFRVLPPDPHRFDGGGDGVGCERG